MYYLSSSILLVFSDSFCVEKAPRAAVSGPSNEYTEEAINSSYQGNFHKIIDVEKNPPKLSATAGSQKVDDYDGDNNPSNSIVPGYNKVEGYDNDSQYCNLIKENYEAVRKTPSKTTMAAAKKLKKACEIDDKLLQRKYEIAGALLSPVTSTLIAKEGENAEKGYNEERISYSLGNYSEDVENYDDDENALKLLEEKYEATGKSPPPVSSASLAKKDQNTKNKYKEEPVSYSLEDYSDDVKNYDDDENALKLLQEKYETAGTLPPPHKAPDEAVHGHNCDHESNDESEQSVTSTPEYAINVEEMDDDDDNLLNQKYQRFESPLPGANFTRRTSQDGIFPTTTDSKNGIDMTLPGAIAIGADKKARFRAHELNINYSSVSLTYEDCNVVSSSNHSVNDQCNHSADEEYIHEPKESAQISLSSQNLRNIAVLVDEELEVEALDRRVEEVLKTATIATAEEIDINGCRRRVYFIGSIAIMFLIVIVVLVPILTSNVTNSESQPTTSPTNTQKPTLETVVERGVLRCGVSPHWPGFSILNKSTGEYEGFQIDSCRSVAAAVMGVNYSIEVVHMPFRESFFALANGSVDILSRGLTHNMERDVYKSDTETSFSFSTPYLYGSLGFGGKPSFLECAENIQFYGNCTELKICVIEKTTHHKILEDLFPVRSLVTVPNPPDIVKKLISGDCNVIAHETSFRSRQYVRSQGYTGEYSVGKTILSKEPLAIVTRDDDHEWSQIVNWVLQAQFLAEAMNITQDNADNFSNISPFGHKYNDMFINAISAVGNYGERYERYLEKIIPRQGLNKLYLDDNQLNDGNNNNNNNNNNGLIYSYPFGSNDNDGPEPTVGSRLRTITERGMLRCGVPEVQDGFAIFDTNRQEWSGIDIDYCKAIAAAMFGGVINSTVEYVNLTTTKNVFDSLIDNNVDVVCGINIDIEANIEMGISFSQPYFYEGKFKSRSLATYGKEDLQFSDFVFWVVSSTFYAEEKAINRFTSNDMPEVRIFGSRFYRIFRDAILTSSNYGEIYERNLQSIIPRSARNNLNTNNLLLGPQINPYVGF